MYKRIIELIVEFSYRTECTIEDLAFKYQVSPQTIRNDIHAINVLLSEHDYEKIQIHKGTVICPENFTEIKRYINLKASEANLYSYHLSREELCIVTTVILLFTEKYITINQLAEQLSVSRTTFINHSSSLREYTQSLGLDMHSSSNKGLILKNTETEKRIALVKLIELTVRENEFLLNLILKSNIVTKQDDRKLTKNILYKIQQEFKISLSNQLFVCLNYYLNFTIEKIRTEHYIDSSPIKEPDFFCCAERILTAVSTACELPVINSEILFLSRVLKDLFLPSGMMEHSRNTMEIQLLTAVLIENISDFLHIDLKHDFQLLESLSSHLTSIYKNSVTDKADNPVLNDVRTTQITVIHAVKENIKPIEQYFQRPLSEVEILYITIHFSAAIERYRSAHYVYRVVVACNAGIGTSQFIKAKLSCFTNIHVIRTVNSWEISSLTTEDADLLISAVPIYQSPIEFINISGNITNQDLMRISKKIRDMYNAGIKPAAIIPNHTADRIISAIRPVLYELIPQDAEKVFQKVKDAVYYAANYTPPVLDSVSSPCLHQLLTPAFIQLDVRCTDWKDTIYQAASPLLQEQYFHQDYLEEMIQITEKYGAYYIVSDGVALLHATPRKNSYKLGMSLTRLDPPVLFHTPDSQKPISYVIFLSVIDKKEHLRALFSLIHLLKDPSFIQQLDLTKTPEDVYHLIYLNEKNIKTNKGEF